MCIKALAPDKQPVVVAHIYEEDRVLLAVCINSAGTFELYFLKDLTVIDNTYISKFEEID